MFTYTYTKPYTSLDDQVELFIKLKREIAEDFQSTYNANVSDLFFALAPKMCYNLAPGEYEVFMDVSSIDNEFAIRFYLAN